MEEIVPAYEGGELKEVGGGSENLCGVGKFSLLGDMESSCSGVALCAYHPKLFRIT